MNVLSLLTLIVVVGVAAQWVASRLQFPALLLLLLTGLLVGPGLRLVKPDEMLGPHLVGPLVSLAVALILFEGGLSLHLREARQVGGTLQRLLLSGLVVGFALTTAAGVWVAHLDLATAGTVGAILVVTGPTVILPMLRTARIAPRPATLLRWEGIVNDPLGAILALFVVNAARITGGLAQGSVLGTAVTFLWTGAVAALAGAIVARVLARSLDRGWIAEHLKSPVILASALGVFALAEALHHEMGLVAVTVMGLVIANIDNRSLEDIRRFKEQITTLLVSTLFIVLSARLEPRDLSAVVGWPLLYIAVIVFVIRPIVVGVATIGSALTWQERIMVGWIAPRGVVAAAVAAKFAPDLTAAGFADGELLVPIIFGVILATVTLHGLSIRPLARRLGLAAVEGNGILIIGASTWGVALAQALAKAGAEVVLADTRFRSVSHARQQGVEVHYGDVLAEEATMELPVERVSWLLAATDDDHYNALACLRFVPELGREALLQITPETAATGREAKAHMTGGSPWGERGTYRAITGRFWTGGSFKVTALTQEYGWDSLQTDNPEALFLFALHQGRRLVPLRPAAVPPAGSKVIYLA